MKNVPIKFRGVDIETGEVVFGRDITQCSDTDVWISDKDSSKMYLVKDVTLLVGYDADGNEVYEGDMLVNLTGTEFKASLKGLITCIKNPSYSLYLGNLKDRQYYRLKG